MPELSIVIPVFNGEKYVQMCYEGIASQSFKDWEAIFVDDGSKDNSPAILDKIAEQDERVAVIHKENGGTATARNAGLNVATGKYITFLDCDDEIKEDMYEKMVSLMNSTQADMGVCGFYYKLEKENNGESETTYLEEKYYPSSVYKTPEEIKEHLVDMWDSDLLSNVWNKLYRMDLIREENLRYRDGHVYTEDRVFNRQFIENCNSIAFTNECLYYYVRERVGSTTEKYRDDSFIIRNKEYNEFTAHYKKLGIWDNKSREYTSREFIERIAGCIENVFHAGKNLTTKQKYDSIKSMVQHPDTREAIKYARCRSKKMRVFVLPIRWNWTPGAYLMGYTIYTIRSKNPVLFHKLKSAR
ncbi:glycosyltransferase [Butyrivibrio sp. AE3009]|uniref:glycosyltransferase n=1 Tax=Butyrivibrio sp. AE3009 TaxID=1280666 RepID=UPI0003B3FA74|nr:glycosyltransferase [Butyrivibrio sp. AE3009]